MEWCGWGSPTEIPSNETPVIWLSRVTGAAATTAKITTAADFNGNRWTTNALLHQAPGEVSYLLPVDALMRLFKRHNGTHGVSVRFAPSSLGVAASRTGSTIFLHIANMNYSGTVEANFAVDGFAATGGRVLEISPENPRQEISPVNPEAFNPREQALSAGDSPRWRFPARSVSVLELECRKA